MSNPRATLDSLRHGSRPVATREESRRPCPERRGWDDDALEDWADDAPPTGGGQAKPGATAADADDPLDAFMAGISRECAKTPAPRVLTPAELKARAEADAEEAREDDPVESYLAARRAAGLPEDGAGGPVGADDSDEEVYAAARRAEAADDDDDEGGGGRKQQMSAEARRRIEPLAPVDHALIAYEEFNKEFYAEPTHLAALSSAEAASRLRSLETVVTGTDPPKPVASFADCALGAQVNAALAKAGYTIPTGIQAAALPAALSGRDVLGLAKTGSGKTAAFILPLVVHAMDQPELAAGDGPIGLIMAPTRELGAQIATEAKRFGRGLGLRTSTVLGGGDKLTQFKELRAGAEIVVGTPGRLIDMIRLKALIMTRVTYVVLDEADRLFDLGFEYQVKSLLGRVRPDRQTLLFSATLPPKVERLCRDALVDPVRISVGAVGQANADVRQHVHVVDSDADKLPWLLARLPSLVDDGQVLIFVGTKAAAASLGMALTTTGYKAGALHGDVDPGGRAAALSDFKAGRSHVLVATDVAARGLDIKDLKTVVCLDAPRDMDAHVHRIGRTGRAGATDGTATTVVTKSQAAFAGE